MTQIEIIKKELVFVSNWIERLVKDIPEDKWNETPPVLETNLNWLMGHLVTSKYFHAVLCVGGKGDYDHGVNTKQYVSLYAYSGKGPLHLPDDKPSPSEILRDLSIMDNLALDVLDKVEEGQLGTPTELPNPVAKTKHEALMWSIKHQMWHGGQIATLKRVLSKA